ncbi:hypothetical protein OHT17_03345 [Streptomyces sp. NBC_00371]|uniref:hypothetical protein n=1 Tax=unclassified Streptomyces TaxID=2593676 RepID=UPI002E257330
MTYRFTARVARTEIDPDGYFTEAALAEGEDGSGFILMFMAGEEDPDDQEVALGMDTHCLVTAQGHCVFAIGPVRRSRV